MTEYPRTLTEHQTLARVVAGASLARFGDGELRQAESACNIKPQRADAALTARLRAILKDAGDCLVGIPNIHAHGPKDYHWKTYARFSKLLAEGTLYGSAFISRPDSAPWVDEPGYWALLQSLWRDRDVTLVRGTTKSFHRDLLLAAGATSVREVLCKPEHAWADYDAILAEIGTPPRVLLCLGPTATVLAVDLCAKGIHAIDLGHAGAFWNKHLRGQPMWKTSDQAKAS
jgi:hypothetical protein